MVIDVLKPKTIKNLNFYRSAILEIFKNLFFFWKLQQFVFVNLYLLPKLIHKMFDFFRIRLCKEHWGLIQAQLSGASIWGGFFESLKHVKISPILSLNSRPCNAHVFVIFWLKFLKSQFLEFLAEFWVKFWCNGKKWFINCGF